MQFLYGLFNNSYMLTIIVVTVLLRLVQIFPDISNRKTQIKMAVVQPQINELQKKYANDPQKLRLEQSKLMKKYGVNTLSSCLPMLITLPLFFCFLAAFRTWGNEESITLMYETAITQTMEEGSEERAKAEDQAMETFKSFEFLWTKNIWQPDCFLDAQFLIFRFDGEVITKPTTLSAINSVSLANMPLLQNGYTNKNGEHISGEQIWKTLVESGLAAGEYGIYLKGVDRAVGGLDKVAAGSIQEVSILNITQEEIAYGHVIGTTGDGRGIGLHGHVGAGEDEGLVAHISTIGAVVGSHKVRNIGIDARAHIVGQQLTFVGGVLFISEVAHPQALGVITAVHPVDSGAIGGNGRCGERQHHRAPTAFLTGMAALSEGALITHRRRSEAERGAIVEAVLELDGALCHVALDHIAALKTSGNGFVATHVIQTVGVGVGNYRIHFQTLKIHSGCSSGNLEVS